MTAGSFEQRSRPRATTTAVVASLGAAVAAVLVAHLSRGALGHHDNAPTSLLLGSLIGSVTTAVVLARGMCGSYGLTPLLIAAQLAAELGLAVSHGADGVLAVAGNTWHLVCAVAVVGLIAGAHRAHDAGQSLGARLLPRWPLGTPVPLLPTQRVSPPPPPFSYPAPSAPPRALHLLRGPPIGA